MYRVLEDVVVLAQIKTEHMVRYYVGQYMIVESYAPGAFRERGNSGGGPHDDPRPRDVRRSRDFLRLGRRVNNMWEMDLAGHVSNVV